MKKKTKSTGKARVEFKITHKEKAQLKKAAKAAGMTVTDYILYYLPI